jgi:hypothetical protein
MRECDTPAHPAVAAREFVIANTRSRRWEKGLWLGKVKDGLVLTVRFVRRDKYIRIYGAGFWREGLARYDNSNKL